MVGKMPHVTCLDGSFMETVKGWQSGWFYITEPRDANWAAAPEFRSCIPMWLTSWKRKVLASGEPAELTGLQNCVKNMISKKIKLVNVVQVMLFRRILPCQRRAFNMWEFDSVKHQTLLELFDTTHKDIWKVLFKASEFPPPTFEDRGLSAKRHANAVSILHFARCAFPQYIRGRNLSHRTDPTGICGNGEADRLSDSVA